MLYCFHALCLPAPSTSCIALCAFACQLTTPFRESLPPFRGSRSYLRMTGPVRGHRGATPLPRPPHRPGVAASRDPAKLLRRGLHGAAAPTGVIWAGLRMGQLGEGMGQERRGSGFCPSSLFPTAVSSGGDQAWRKVCANPTPSFEFPLLSSVLNSRLCCCFLRPALFPLPRKLTHRWKDQ